MRAKILAVLLLAALLSSCALSACSSIRARESEQPGVQTSAPPRPVDKPELTPEPAFEPGETVYVDGVPAESGAELDGIVYIGLREFCELLDLELTEDGRDFFFRWRGLPVEGSLETEILIVDSELLPLEGPILLRGGELMLPARSLCEHLKIGVLHDEEYGAWYFTPSAGEWKLPVGYSVPVLMYHGVSDSPWGSVELFVSPDEMEEQLRYLLDEGYEPIWFEDLEHVDQYDKPIILSFDDGYADNYTELFPLLKKYDVKETIFVVTDWNWGLYLTDDMIREMVDSGLVSIQSHTKSHRRLSELGDEQLEEQLWQSKLAITRLTGREPFVLCYPEGAASLHTAEFVERWYRFGVMMSGPRYTTGDDPLWVYRIFIGRGTYTAYFEILLDL